MKITAVQVAAAALIFGFNSTMGQSLRATNQRQAIHQQSNRALGDSETTQQSCIYELALALSGSGNTTAWVGKTPFKGFCVDGYQTSDIKKIYWYDASPEIEYHESFGAEYVNSALFQTAVTECEDNIPCSERSYNSKSCEANYQQTYTLIGDDDGEGETYTIHDCGYLWGSSAPTSQPTPSPTVRTITAVDDNFSAIRGIAMSEDVAENDVGAKATDEITFVDAPTVTVEEACSDIGTLSSYFTSLIFTPSTEHDVSECWVYYQYTTASSNIATVTIKISGSQDRALRQSSGDLEVPVSEPTSQPTISPSEAPTSTKVTAVDDEYSVTRGQEITVDVSSNDVGADSSDDIELFYPSNRLLDCSQIGTVTQDHTTITFTPSTSFYVSKCYIYYEYTTTSNLAMAEVIFTITDN